MNAFRKDHAAAAFRLGILVVSVAFIFTVRPSGSVRAQDRRNDGPPVVKVLTPANNSTYKWSSLVIYHVVVTYKGESTEYQELPASQVLLAATYVPDLSAMTAKPSPGAGPTPAGLLAIIQSNCMGCHQFRAKAMGPSFAAIAARYPWSSATTEALSHDIRNGSSGTWGQQTMPPHPELTEGQARSVALWIMRHASDPNVKYYVGTQGTIRMAPTGTPGANAGIVLTASYSSPAPDGTPDHAPHGDETIVLHGK